MNLSCFCLQSKGVSVDELDKKLHQHKATASTIAAIELQEQELREAEELAALQGLFCWVIL